VLSQSGETWAGAARRPGVRAGGGTERPEGSVAVVDTDLSGAPPCPAGGTSAAMGGASASWWWRCLSCYPLERQVATARGRVAAWSHRRV